MRVFTLFLAAVALLGGCYSMPTRDYATNPITLPSTPQSAQPAWGTQGEQYQTIMVNTPQGLVYKRCKVINGKAVACL